jgi:hypothetical protein
MLSPSQCAGADRSTFVIGTCESRCWLSVAVQLTVFGPVGNMDPLAGVQATATGGAPLTTVGVPYTTEIGMDSGARSVIGAGHVIFGGSGTGGGTGVGCAGGELQAWTASAHTSKPRAWRQKRVG